MIDCFLIYYLTIFGMQLSSVKSQQEPKKEREGYPYAGGLLIKAFSSTTVQRKNHMEANLKLK